jgi:rubrerythrin
MKKQFISFSLLIFMTVPLFISCQNEKALEKITAKQHIKYEAETLENLQTAYSFELTSSAKHEAFSRTAEAEGFHNITLLYNALSLSENIHAVNIKAALEDGGGKALPIKKEFRVKSTKENLSDGMHEETFGSNIMYPEFLKKAELADNSVASLSISLALKSEKKHKFFFEQALANLNTNKLNMLHTVYFVCPVCGNVYTNPPKHCELSLTERHQFVKFQN